MMMTLKNCLDKFSCDLELQVSKSVGNQYGSGLLSKGSQGIHQILSGFALSRRWFNLKYIVLNQVYHKVEKHPSRQCIQEPLGNQTRQAAISHNYLVHKISF